MAFMRKSKQTFLLIYYIAIILIMALHSSTENTPMILRLGYLAALFVPLISNIQFFPPVLICSLLISQNSFAYPLIPDDNYYYIIIALLFALWAVTNYSTSNDSYNRLSPFFIAVLIYLISVNLLMDGHILDITTSLFICMMLYVCASRDLAINSRLISTAFMVFSLSMSCLLFFHPEARLIAAHGEENTTWADPNYLGGMVGIGCVLAFMCIIYYKNTLLQFVICVLTIIASMYFLALMASRGAILAVGVGTITLSLFSNIRRSTKFLSVLVVVGVILFVYYSEAFAVLMSRFSLEDSTGTGRTLIWGSKLRGFLQEGSFFNILLGFGAERGFLLGSAEMGKAWAFHNDFLAVLVEYGIIGFFVFLSILAYPFRIAEKNDKPVVGALLLYIITLGMTLEPILSGRFVFISYLLYIIIMAKSGVAKRHNSIVTNE